MQNTASRRSLLQAAGLIYAAAAFLSALAFFALFVIFLGNLPKASKVWIEPTVDVGAGLAPFAAAVIDTALVALFGLQHSLMARPFFKNWMTRTVPQELERATYVMAASLAGFILLAFWQPIPLVIWHVPAPGAVILWGLFAAGWSILLTSALAFDIFELFGLRQAWAWYRGRPMPPSTLKTHRLYGWMRHPMYVGLLLGVWTTPHMTAGHALLAATMTLYTLIGMRHEERDLSARFGAPYAAWREGADRDRLPGGRDATGAR